MYLAAMVVSAIICEVQGKLHLRIFLNDNEEKTAMKKRRLPDGEDRCLQEIDAAL